MVTILEVKGSLPGPEDLTAVFDKNATKWAYQKEKHTNSEIREYHYQCCIEFKYRIRKSSLINLLSEELNHDMNGVRVDKMEGTWKTAIAYCTKSDTRHDDEPVLSKSEQVTYKNEDVDFLLEKHNRFHWQATLCEELFNEVPYSLKNSDDRTIYWITDEAGNNGKSKFTKFLCVYNTNIHKLAFGTGAQIRSSVIAAGPKQMYVCDIPRQLGDDDSINSILSSLEDVKNGFVTSAFYGQANQLLMNPPHVVIFSNKECPKEKMSSDRWREYRIIGKKLFKYHDGGYLEIGI